MSFKEVSLTKKMNFPGSGINKKKGIMKHFKLYYTAVHLDWTLEKNACGQDAAQVIAHFHENYPWAKLLDWRELTLPEHEAEVVA